jgi:hypothetical protein
MDKTLNETPKTIFDPVVLGLSFCQKFDFKAIGFRLLPIEHTVNHLLIKLKHKITYILFRHPGHSKLSTTKYRG